jgi:MraZ protein
MLLGEHEHTLDDKNRLTLPAKFRATFAGGVVLSRGMDGCLYAYRREDWDGLVESRLAALDPLSKEGRRMQRFFFTGAAEAELDRQGRVMVPAALIQHAGLGRNVVIAGMRDHLEIWDADAWRNEVNEVEGSAEDVAERLATKRD